MWSTGRHATAYHWWDGDCVVTVHRNSDGHEVWGDMPVKASTLAEVPAVARARLERVGWLLVDDWWEFPGPAGPVWLADVEYRPPT